MGLCSCFCFWFAKEAGAAGGTRVCPALGEPQGGLPGVWPDGPGALGSALRLTRHWNVVCGLEFSLGPFLVSHREEVSFVRTVLQFTENFAGCHLT